MTENAGKLEKHIETFKNDISNLFGEDIVSVTLFGSSVTPDYIPGKTELHFLVVLTRKGIENIDKARFSYRKWRGNKIDLPLFVTEAYINASLDSFPVEFLTMKNSSRVVMGKDILSDLEFAGKDIRLQSEREVKGYLLKLRQGFIQTRGLKRQLKLLIAESLTAFRMLFEAMLFLKGNDIPGTGNDVFLQACAAFNLDGTLFTELMNVSMKGEKRTSAELDNLMRSYIQEVEKISEIIDKMVVK